MGRKDEATLAEAFEKVMEGEIERERERDEPSLTGKSQMSGEID